MQFYMKLCGACVIFLLFVKVNGYVLLAANVDDFRQIAKKIVSQQVVEKIVDALGQQQKNKPLSIEASESGEKNIGRELNIEDPYESRPRIAQNRPRNKNFHVQANNERPPKRIVRTTRSNRFNVQRNPTTEQAVEAFEIKNDRRGDNYKTEDIKWVEDEDIMPTTDAHPRVSRTVTRKHEDHLLYDKYDLSKTKKDDNDYDDYTSRRPSRPRDSIKSDKKRDRINSPERYPATEEQDKYYENQKPEPVKKFGKPAKLYNNDRVEPETPYKKGRGERPYDKDSQYIPKRYTKEKGREYSIERITPSKNNEKHDQGLAIPYSKENEYQVSHVSKEFNGRPGSRQKQKKVTIEYITKKKVNEEVPYSNYNSNRKGEEKSSKFATRIQKQSKFTIVTPTYHLKDPNVAVKYDFNEPIPERDREADKGLYNVEEIRVNGRVLE